MPRKFFLSLNLDNGRAQYKDGPCSDSENCPPFPPTFTFQPRTILSSANGMQIFVTSSSGKRQTLEVESSDSVSSIRKRIHRMEGIRLEQIRLVYDGKQLEDSRTLADYNVQHRAAVHIRLEMRGD